MSVGMGSKAETASESPRDGRTSGAFAVVHPVHPPLSSAEIVEGILHGSPRAKAALFDRFSGEVHRIVARICGVDADLSDLVQEVFVAALESVDELEDPGALKAWLRSIAVFTARKRLRKQRRHRWLLFFACDEVPEPAVEAADAECLEAVRATYAILDTLSPDDRIAFTLRVIEGMETTEVADACGVSLATIKRRIAHARARFEVKARRHPALCDLVERELG